jgi:hypothetical protein
MMLCDDGRDWEREFYELLASHPELKDIAALQQNYVDVKLGLQGGIDSGGFAWVLVPMTQRTVLKWVYAYNAIADHGCIEAYTWLWRYFLSPLGYCMETLLPYLHEDVLRLKDPFLHPEGEPPSWVIPTDPEEEQ